MTFHLNEAKACWTPAGFNFNSNYLDRQRVGQFPSVFPLCAFVEVSNSYLRGGGDMSGGVARNVENGEEDNKANVQRCSRLRLTLQDQDQAGCPSARYGNKESSIAVVLPHKPEKQEETFELITPTEEKVEVIKVYLEARPKKTESVRMLTDEVTQIQEVRYCLKTLREQMAARQNSKNHKYPVNGIRVNKPSSQPAVTNGNTVLIESDAHVEDNQEESVRLREASKRLYAQLKEMEKRHQEEREKLQAESNAYFLRLADQSEQLQKAEEKSEERGQKVEELQRLLGSMEIESGILKDKMAAQEAELQQLKADREEEQKEKRRAELEREVAVLKEKIHHLDDMLKSQQRKVRHMIEQLQNSRTVIQERDRVIMDLEEKVAFLEAENREMHDHMEYFLAGQDPLSLTSTENKPEIVYSKPLTPSTQSNKALPFIKVIETKS
ncbi:tuftelin 1b isoform X2 [Micropterus salmoides]|uniref:tuftelin 1b isoform X2 n=1 Tax=Micropterus salmoides TaxID=27706 RepID=UPI0018EDA2E0|nr:tuftelin 1b isoform X2 [Micropterus salmoides]